MPKLKSELVDQLDTISDIANDADLTQGQALAAIQEQLADDDDDDDEDDEE